jgi:hypothetical protein
MLIVHNTVFWDTTFISDFTYCVHFTANCFLGNCIFGIGNPQFSERFDWGYEGKIANYGIYLLVILNIFIENERSGFNWGYSIYPVKFFEEEERSEFNRD